MPIRRRAFLGGLAAAAAGCALHRRSSSTTSTATSTRTGDALAAHKPMRILVLGGTHFVGPALVHAARARGHTLTLFNRGKTNPGLFPDVETILGDRRFDLKKLAGREWDAVVDTFAMLPKSVTAAAEMLRDRVAQYVFVSTISVYKLGRDPIDESSPVLTPPVVNPDKIDSVEAYGGNKQLAEHAAEAAMPGRTTALRSGVIVGPGDPSDRFIYWPLRLRRGGDVLVPGAADDHLPYIDVRDLGAFIVHAIEERVVGTYNTVGPTNARLASVLDGMHDVSAPDTRLTWVADRTWLEAEKADGWDSFPLVCGQHDAQSGFGKVSAARAIARGLAFRPTAETARDALAWWDQQPEARRNQPRPGVTPEREAELLEKWRARSHG